MKCRYAWSFAMILVLASGSVCAAKLDVDTRQPPDPQPAGGPTGDGEDWAGDGRAPLTDNDATDDVESKGAERSKGKEPSAPAVTERPAKPADNSEGTR